MFKLLSAFRKDKVWNFNGGIHPPEMRTQSNGIPLRQISLPRRLIILLKQHIGAESGLCIKVGNRVLRGQPLARGWGRILPVRAPASSTVIAIVPHTTAYPSGLAEMSVIIDADGEDHQIERDGRSDYQVRTRETLIERIHRFDVAGLGDVGFPTGSKLRGGGDKIKTLITNAAEYEPYVTANDRLMQDCAAQIVNRIHVLAHILQPDEVLIGIEKNKPQAIPVLRAVLCGAHGISLCMIPIKYPSGGAKQLTQILTGKQVPHGGCSSDAGVLMRNMGTAYAIKRAVVDGGPLTERAVTLADKAVSRSGNIWACLGTPVRHLLNDADFCASAESMVIMGGPPMGFTLSGLDVPVMKITNCLLAPSASEMGEPQEERGHIRCSVCADACPANLLPQQPYWFSKGQQHDKATAHNLADCIERGAYAWVCPSSIPLMQYLRQGKTEISTIRQEGQHITEAKARFEARRARLECEKATRAERHKEAAAQPAAKDQDTINAALARVRDKQRGAMQPIMIQSDTKPDSSETIAAREARKTETRAHKAQQQAASVEAPVAEPVDPHEATVETVIVRAKTRKAEQQVAPMKAPAAEPVDPYKAVVEVVIARARTHKAGQQTTPMEAPVIEPVDPRKAAVEAAIAHAKAREAEQQVAPIEAPVTEPVDPRKAAVKAAVARAKAHKTEQQVAPVEAPVAEPIDPRKTTAEATTTCAKTCKAEQQAAQPDLASVTANDGPCKAAVTVTIAHVQARKATQQAVNEE